MLKLVVVLSVLGVSLGLPTNSTTNDVNPRIVGGDETDISRNPWQLALLYHNQHYCGAVEIHPRWGLTAAHCLEGVDVQHLSVRAGSTTRNRGGQVIDVVRFYEHPEFNRRTVDYDFGLLELDEPISIITASPIGLPEPHSEILEGDSAHISGWGLLSPNGVAPEILHRVEVPVVSRELCQWVHQYHTITDRMFCTGDLFDGGKDACRGDGGGPVIVNGRLGGLVSWGSGCGEPNSPAVHARVAVVLDWIYQTSGI